MRCCPKRIGALCLTGIILFLSACGGQTGSKELTAGVDSQVKEVTAVPLTDLQAAALTDFGLKLLREGSAGEDNTLMSPLSILCALGMTANGAQGETLAQMESLFGMDIPTLNGALHTWLTPEKTGDTLSLANAIWLKEKEGLQIDESFLETCRDWYQASVNAAPLDDGTCQEINRWVKDQTHGMIPKILNSIPPDAVMYLVNALAFEGKWAKTYRTDQVGEGIFITEDGREQPAEFMYSEEFFYLEDEGARGFCKEYTNKNYLFAVLLPDEGITVEEYLSGLTGERLCHVLDTMTTGMVMAALPKYQASWEGDLAELLSSLGMTDAFDSDHADLSGIGTSEANLAISRVLHKTFFAVDENGTRAGAATAVEVEESAAAEMETVRLDRPFVYMIIDRESKMPIFLGTLMSLEG